MHEVTEAEFQERAHPRGRDGKFVATFDAPLGRITGTRQTKREYTHAVVMHWPDEETRERARLADRADKEYLRAHRTPEEYEEVLAGVDERHSTPGHVLSFHGTETAAEKEAAKALRDRGATGRRYKVVKARPATLREAALFTGRLHPRDRAGRFRLVKGASGPSATDLAKAEKARARRRERLQQRARHRGGEYNAALRQMGHRYSVTERFEGRDDSMMGDKVLEAHDYFEATKLRLVVEGRDEREAASVAVTAGIGRFGPDFPEMVQVGRELFEAELADAADELLEAADSLAKASSPSPLSRSKTSNWVARNGGLPAYIQHIAKALMKERGKSESQAVQMAIGIVKRWARGGGNVDAGTRAAATKAVAEWEKLKAKAHAK